MVPQKNHFGQKGSLFASQFYFREAVHHRFMMPTPRVFVIRFWLLPKVCWQHPCGQPVAL
jgi:hypothetical protein